MGQRSSVLRARRIEVLSATSTLLPGFDYADAFSVTEPAAVPARRWAALVLAGGPKLGHQLFGRLVWHGLLGFDLALGGTPDTMAGWRITVDEDALFVLAADGRQMEGRMAFAREDATLTWTTALRFHHPAARPIWFAAQHVHRALVPRLLDRAARSPSMQSQSSEG